jgi:putative ABC transport system permease protein
MRSARNLRLSVRALAAHRTRAALAILGTAVGVGGVLVLTAIAQGARSEVLRSIESLGRNVLVINAGKLQSRAGRQVAGEGWTRRLRADDATAIVQGSSAVLRAAPVQEIGSVARFGPIGNPTTVLGTTPEWRIVRQYPLAEGRFFTHNENERRARVAVIGHETRTSLFSDSIDPLGKTIRVGRVPFVVIGVLASKGVSVDGAATEDDRIVIPLETALHRMSNLVYVKAIYLEAASAQVMATAERDAAAILRVRHNLPVGVTDDFAIQNQQRLLRTELAARASFRRLIIGLGFLALLIGGVGILSIMMLSIRERRGEIGLRVAVGARQRDVLMQFLTEALILAIAGGLAGLALGIGTAEIVQRNTTWEVAVTAQTIALAIGSAIAIGVVFGVVPAWKAAKLAPIEALRAE